jgi:hypothetical protein
MLTYTVLWATENSSAFFEGLAYEKESHKITTYLASLTFQYVLNTYMSI